MPRIFDEVLRCVFYVYEGRDAPPARDASGGTGFFFGVASKRHSEYHHLYAVTCAHIVGGGQFDPVLTINTQDGGYKFLLTRRGDWVTSENDDLAVYPVERLGESYSYAQFGSGDVLTREMLEAWGIGPGDEAIMVGRFRGHEGTKRNLPAAMFGNISAMPDEPIDNTFTGKPQDSYLVEMRTISGYSGSPVMIHVPPMTPRPNTNRLSNRWLTGALFGVLWGHLPVDEKARDENGRLYRISAASAMAAVVPIHKLTDLLESQDLESMRMHAEAKLD